MNKNIEKSTKCDIIVEKGGQKMSNLIELEAGYKLTDFENILKKIKYLFMLKKNILII